MDKYLMIVLLLAPGFLASSMAFFLHAFPDKGTEVKNIMRYFTYSLFALFATAVSGLALGFYTGTDTFADVCGRFADIGYTLKFTAVLIVVSTMTGAAWPLAGKRLILRMANKLNEKTSMNCVFPDGRLIDDMLDDGNHHFIIVEKDGKLIAMGLYNVCSISPIFQLAWQTDNIDTNFCLPSRIGSGGILDGKIVCCRGSFFRFCKIDDKKMVQSQNLWD